jgi:hypothetical protein
MMDWLRKVVQDPRTERFIMALIVLNAVTLGLEMSEARWRASAWLSPSSTGW